MQHNISLKRDTTKALSPIGPRWANIKQINHLRIDSSLPLGTVQDQSERIMNAVIFEVWPINESGKEDLDLPTELRTLLEQIERPFLLSALRV